MTTQGREDNQAIVGLGATGLGASRLVKNLVLPVLFLLSIFLQGCISYDASLTLRTQKDNRKLSADFSQTYIDRDDAGDYMIVLLNDPIDQVHPSAAGKPLDAVKVAPLRQVMIIRVLWRPMKGAKFDHPVAINATMHWYIFDRSALSNGYLHYSGNAFVDVFPEGDRASIDIRNAVIKLTDHAGELTDPIGPVRIKGSFDCKVDQRRVADLIAEVKERTTQFASAPDSPPERLRSAP